MTIDFRSATEQLSRGVSDEMIAEAAQVSDWQRVLATLARDRARELTALADELHPIELDPNWEDRYG